KLRLLLVINCWGKSFPVHRRYNDSRVARRVRGAPTQHSRPPPARTALIHFSLLPTVAAIGRAHSATRLIDESGRARRPWAPRTRSPSVCYHRTGFPAALLSAYGVPHPNAWLGAPLISMAGRAPPQSRNTPVSKLAMHAQGAPLIIQNRHDRRKYTTAPEQRSHRPLAQTEHISRDRCDAPEGNRPRNQQQQARSTRGGRNNNTDAVSVASDESSGSTNSETMLPRIIKPRKRRKKDRKPNNIVPHDLSSAGLDLGDVDHCAVSGLNSSHGIYEDTYCREMSLPYRLDVKVLEYPEPVPETYRVSALGEALEATRFGLAEAASPAESAVSSYLLDENSCGDFAPTKLEESMKVVGPLEREEQTRRCDAAGAILHRGFRNDERLTPAKHIPPQIFTHCSHQREELARRNRGLRSL
ncbi:hypothetical protein HW555_014019, partial [Spodoptera exigua]